MSTNDEQLPVHDIAARASKIIALGVAGDYAAADQAARTFVDEYGAHWLALLCAATVEAAGGLTCCPPVSPDEAPETPELLRADKAARDFLSVYPRDTRQVFNRHYRDDEEGQNFLTALYALAVHAARHMHEAATPNVHLLDGPALDLPPATIDAATAAEITARIAALPRRT